MSDYKPQAGDKVQYKTVDRDGTVVTTVGVVHEIAWNGSAYSENERTLYNPYLPERTTLLERPTPPLVTEPGTLYGDPTDVGLRAVRINFPGGTTGLWLGNAGDSRDWFYNRDVEYLIQEEGWVRMDFEGNVIDDD